MKRIGTGGTPVSRALLAQRQSTPPITGRPESRELHGASEKLALAAQSDELRSTKPVVGGSNPSQCIADASDCICCSCNVALVAQWPSRRFLTSGMQVRVLPGA